MTATPDRLLTSSTFCELVYGDDDDYDEYFSHSSSNSSHQSVSTGAELEPSSPHLEEKIEISLIDTGVLDTAEADGETSLAKFKVEIELSNENGVCMEDSCASDDSSCIKEVVLDNEENDPNGTTHNEDAKENLVSISCQDPTPRALSESDVKCIDDGLMPDKSFDEPIVEKSQDAVDEEEKKVSNECKANTGSCMKSEAILEENTTAAGDDRCFENDEVGVEVEVMNENVIYTEICIYDGASTVSEVGLDNK